MPSKDRSDNSALVTMEDAGVVELSREEYDRLLAGISTPNPAPAVEEGPHLKDRDVAEAKRAQLENAGVTGDEEWMTDDMRSVLKGGR